MTVPDLLILGVNPHAVEMAGIVDRINRVENTWNLRAFVSPYGDRAGEELLGFPVLDMKHAAEQYPEALVIPEYDWPYKSEIPGDRLATLIDPTAFVSQTAHIGRGCVIYPNCYIGSYARIGDLLFCLSGSVINHNDVIEDRVTLTSSATLAGDVHIESDCYLGQSCSVREMLRIGKGSMIGMGCVVLHDVSPNSVMVGNPARKLRVRQLDFPGVSYLRAAKQVASKGIRAMCLMTRSLNARLLNK